MGSEVVRKAGELTRKGMCSVFQDYSLTFMVN